MMVSVFAEYFVGVSMCGRALAAPRPRDPIHRSVQRLLPLRREKDFAEGQRLLVACRGELIRLGSAKPIPTSWRRVKVMNLDLFGVR